MITSVMLFHCTGACSSAVHACIASPSVTMILLMEMASVYFVVPAELRGVLLLYLGWALSRFLNRSTLPGLMTVISTLLPEPRSLSTPDWIAALTRLMASVCSM
eukprot:34051_2